MTYVFDKLSAAFNAVMPKDINRAPRVLVLDRKQLVVLRQPRQLDLAIRANDIDKVVELLDKGANPNLVTDFSGPALNEAVNAGNPDMMALLLRRGAKVDVANTAGTTPLHRAVSSFNRDEEKLPLVRILLDAGANPHAVDCHGETPLSLAKHFSNTKIEQTIVDFIAAQPPATPGKSPKP